MSAEKKKQLGVLGLMVALVAVLAGSILFVGAASGWFDDPKVVLDKEYYGEFDGDDCGECDVSDDCAGCGMMNLSAEEYEELVGKGASFVVMVDQDGCTTADRLRGYVGDWAREAGVKVYRMMFEDAKETSLHEVVKYYPSFVVVSKGVVRGWLRADSDEDAAAYNDYAAFREWVGKYL